MERDAPSIKVTAWGQGPYCLSFEQFAVYEIQNHEVAHEKAKEILRDREADNGQEEHWAFQEYELYDRSALEEQIKEYEKETS